jgi:hypothetical protein
MTQKYGIQAKGDLAETSRLAQHRADGVKAMNLNQFTNADNCPLVDLITEDGLESVKAYSDPKQVIAHLRDLQAPDNWASSAVRDLRSQTVAFLQKNAEALQKDGLWPEGVPEDAPARELGAVVRHTKVVCADDGVPSEEALATDIRENAPWWNVWEKVDTPAFHEAVRARTGLMMKRIAGCGKTGAELQAYAEANVPQTVTAVDVSSIDDFAMPQPDKPATAAAEPATSPAQAAAMPVGEPSPASIVPLVDGGGAR